MISKFFVFASAVAIAAAQLTFSTPAIAADHHDAFLVIFPPPASVNPLGWRNTLSLDDWLKLLATETCGGMKVPKTEIFAQCVATEARRLDEFYRRVHEASFHMRRCVAWRPC
jgi:hypothetical protein